MRLIIIYSFLILLGASCSKNDACEKWVEVVPAGNNEISDTVTVYPDAITVYREEVFIDGIKTVRYDYDRVKELYNDHNAAYTMYVLKDRKSGYYEFLTVYKYNKDTVSFDLSNIALKYFKTSQALIDTMNNTTYGNKTIYAMFGAARVNHKPFYLLTKK